MKNRTNFINYPLAIMGMFLMLTNSCKKDKENINTVKDIDGNVYHTVTIGSQVWMVENLKVTHYSNGDPIANIPDSISSDSSLNSILIPIFCDYNFDRVNALDYGHLYNWFAVNDKRKLAPNGWHIPTEQDWNALLYYININGKSAGKILPEAGTLHWYSNSCADNELGFTALPGGCYVPYGTFGRIKTDGQWWTSTENDSISASAFSINSNSSTICLYAAISNHAPKTLGLSIRCIKD